MTGDRLPLAELMAKAGGGAFMLSMVEPTSPTRGMRVATISCIPCKTAVRDRA